MVAPMVAPCHPNHDCEDGIARNYDDPYYSNVEKTYHHSDAPIEPSSSSILTSSVSPGSGGGGDHGHTHGYHHQEEGLRSGNLVVSPNSAGLQTTTHFYDSEQFNYPEESYDYEEGKALIM